MQTLRSENDGSRWPRSSRFCDRCRGPLLLKVEEGQVLVITALCAVALLGFLALAIDVGVLFRAKRNVQIAADAAATSAALDYYYNASTSRTGIDTSAAKEAADVGRTAALTDGMSSTDTITVNTAWDGAFAGKDGYFEAVIQKPIRTIFMGIFNQNFVSVAARAVAGTPYAADYCMEALASSGTLGNGKSKGTSTMLLQGSFDIEASKCGIMVNGLGSDALDFGNTNGKADLNAESISVVGGCNGTTSCPTGSSSGAPYVVNGVAPVQDPLSAISQDPPSTSSCSPAPGGSLTNTVGTAGGTICYSGSVKVSNATLLGTLVFTGPVEFDGNITTGAFGTTIDIASNSTAKDPAFKVKSSANVTLNAPQTGPYAGIVLMSPSQYSGTLELDFGASCAKINGIIYAPASNLFFQDSGCDHNGGLSMTSDIIVGTFQDDTATIKITSYSQKNPTITPLKAVALVE